jgi:hypothetical protein
MKTNPNEPINPVKDADGRFIHQTIENRDWINQINPFIGLTKREYFAAMAMQALLSNYESRKPYLYDIYDVVTQAAVIYADNLINDLNKEEDENNKTKL